MNRAQRQLMFGYPQNRRGVGRDRLEDYVRVVMTQPQRIRDALAQMAETQRILDAPRRPATPAGWGTFIASFDITPAPDWDQLLESFDTIY